MTRGEYENQDRIYAGESENFMNSYICKDLSLLQPLKQDRILSACPKALCVCMFVCVCVCVETERQRERNSIKGEKKVHEFIHLKDNFDRDQIEKCTSQTTRLEYKQDENMSRILIEEIDIINYAFFL